MSFIFGWFFGQKLEDIGICVVFVEQQDVSIVFWCGVFLSCFLDTFCDILANTMLFRLVFVDDFGVSCEVFVWKASKTRSFCLVDGSIVKQQEAATRASQSNRQRFRSNATKETEDTSRIRMDVITPPPFPPPPPHRAERQMQV